MSAPVINLTQTTSASYLLLASLDISRRNLALRGQETMTRVAALAEYARAEINAIGDYDAFSKERINGTSFFDFDITKLSVHTLGLGLAGIEVYDLLRDEYGIQIEFGDIGNILAYVSVGDREREIERLVSAMADLRRRFKRTGTAGMLTQEYIPPQVVLSPQDAFYGRKVRLPLEQCEGRVCGEFVMCYPPGIPILAPGERITRDDTGLYHLCQGQGLQPDRPGGPAHRIPERADKGVRTMELWFTERHTPYVNFSIKVERQLYTAQSEFRADRRVRVAGIRPLPDA